MHTLHIEHHITDFATWNAAFDRLADMRARSGVRGQRILQPIDDMQYIVIDLDFASALEAQTFLEFLRTKVRSSTDSSPALAGGPRTMILEPAMSQ